MLMQHKYILAIFHYVTIIMHFLSVNLCTMTILKLLEWNYPDRIQVQVSKYKISKKLYKSHFFIQCMNIQNLFFSDHEAEKNQL